MAASATALSTSLIGVFRSHSERVEIALAETIGMIPLVATWCGQRIHRPSLGLVNDGSVPDGPFPQVLVAAVELDTIPQYSQEMIVECPVHVWFVYDEDRIVLTREQRRVSSIADYLTRALYRDRKASKLIVPSYNDANGNERPVVDKLLSATRVQVGPAMRREEIQTMHREAARLAAGEIDLPELYDMMPTGVYLELEFRYQYTVKAATFAPDGFTPEED